MKHIFTRLWETIRHPVDAYQCWRMEKRDAADAREIAARIKKFNDPTASGDE